MSEQGAVAKALESPAIGIVGSVADFSAVFFLLNSQPVLLWITHHPRITILITAFLVLLLVGLLNAWLRARSVARRSQVALRELTCEPSPQDRARFAEFWKDFGADSHLYFWLKNGYMVDKAQYRDLRTLDSVVSKWNDDLTNYHDSELSAAFSELHKELSSVQHATVTYYWRHKDVSLLDDSTIFSVSLDWELVAEEQRNKAIGELETVHDRVMEAYENFVNLAHRKKLTTK